MMMRPITYFSFLGAVLLAFLTGCVGSPIWLASQPGRQVVEIDGMRISVVQRNADHYDAVFLGVSTSHNMLDFKEREIKAIEQVSGCKVVDSEFLPGTVVLNTRVACHNP